MVPSHLFQFIFLCFSATHIYQRANGYKLGRTERSRGCWIPLCFYPCGTLKTSLQTSLTIPNETLRQASACHSLAPVSHLHLHTVISVLSWVCCAKKRITHTYEGHMTPFWFLSSFPALSSHIFKQPSQTTIITLSEGLAHPPTCQPSLKPKPLKRLLTSSIFVWP